MRLERNARVKGVDIVASLADGARGSSGVGDGWPGAVVTASAFAVGHQQSGLAQSLQVVARGLLGDRRFAGRPYGSSRLALTSLIQLARQHHHVVPIHLPPFHRLDVARTPDPRYS